MAASGLVHGRGAKTTGGTVMGAAALAKSQASMSRVGPSNKNVMATRAARPGPKGTIKGLTGALSGPDKGAGAA